MRSSLKLSALVLAVLSVASVACSDDDAAGTPPPGGTAGSTSGKGGASAGGTSAAAGASAGGTDAGGAHAGGSHASGGDAGAGGGASGDPIDLAGCTFATATDGLSGPQTITVGVGGFKYSPPCLKVKVGTEVTWTGSSDTHPLKRFSTKGTGGSPIPERSTESTITVTFTAKGSFGYYCGNHGGDGSTAGMVGAVYVVE